MKRAMVGILAVVLLAAFASPVMAISPYSSDVKSFASPGVDCGNVLVSKGGTLIATIDLSSNNNAACLSASTTFDVCAVLNGSVTFITQVSDNNTPNGRISLLEGTKIGVFGSNSFDYLDFRPGDGACGGTVEYTSGQPR